MWRHSVVAFRSLSPAIFNVLIKPSQMSAPWYAAFSFLALQHVVAYKITTLCKLTSVQSCGSIPVPNVELENILQLTSLILVRCLRWKSQNLCFGCHGREPSLFPLQLCGLRGCMNPNCMTKTTACQQGDIKKPHCCQSEQSMVPNLP